MEKIANGTRQNTVKFKIHSLKQFLISCFKDVIAGLEDSDYVLDF